MLFCAGPWPSVTKALRSSSCCSVNAGLWGQESTPLAAPVVHQPPGGGGTECQRLPCPLLSSAPLAFPPAYAPPLGSPSPSPFPPQLYPMNPPNTASSQHPQGCHAPAPPSSQHHPKSRGLSCSEESTHPCPCETSPFPSVCGNLTLLPPMPSSYSRGGAGHAQWVGTKSWGGGGQ